MMSITILYKFKTVKNTIYLTNLKAYNNHDDNK